MQAPSNQPSAVSHEEALSRLQSAVSQETPEAGVIYSREFNARQLEYFKRGYAIDQYGTMTPPEYFRKEGEQRLLHRMGVSYDTTNRSKMAEWHKRQLALLEKANQAPRCEHVFMDGTTCESPRMKKHKYCYAHERMWEVRPKKLKLLPAEDENSIMWNIMEIQRALIDDEISEKKAGLLLYGQQLQLIAVRGVTFKMTEPGAMVRSMPKGVTMHHGDNHPSSPKPGAPGAPHTEARRKEELAADERGETQKKPTADETDGTDRNTQTKTPEPQRTQRDTEEQARESRCLTPIVKDKEHRQECLCHTSMERVPGDESDKSLLFGDEAGRGKGRA